MSKGAFRSRLLSMRIAVLGIAALYIGSTTLTPLYPIYQRKFGCRRFSEPRAALSGARG